MNIIDATPPPNFPEQVIVMDREFARRHPDKGFFVRVKDDEAVNMVNLDGELTLPDARAAARKLGYEPTHWMEVGRSLTAF